MKKIPLFVLFVTLFVSVHLTFGDTIVPGETIPGDMISFSTSKSPIIPIIKGKANKAWEAELAGFSYGDLLPEGGEITSASVQFQWWGRKINKISQLDLYLDGILVLDFGEYYRGLNESDQKLLKRTLKRQGMIDFSFQFTEDDFEKLEDGEASLTLVGKPNAFRSLQLGEVTLSIIDPVSTGPFGEVTPGIIDPDSTGTFGEGPAPNGAAVPEPATMLLLGSGLIGLVGYGRKKLF